MTDKCFDSALLLVSVEKCCFWKAKRWGCSFWDSSKILGFRMQVLYSGTSSGRAGKMKGKFCSLPWAPVELQLSIRGSVSWIDHLEQQSDQGGGHQNQQPAADSNAHPCSLVSHWNQGLYLQDCLVTFVGFSLVHSSACAVNWRWTV